ncbi:MAG: exodeoxyribonuclease VII large subunit [Bacteroidales bacterium]|nr:exodeoxyribonuclease VII large subunit [Bacteroidales bacterium]MDD2424880.1 exodeoxyribonuclease VII large subunit [Bacteroidales bacterium]MDD3989735.1 exodeoxyribonuclease VII large subunit [Bacteroidales bacterium]MDD4638866.1 exodeoxyribonuclease VII large subunit [Bacteroidales bacterium]
MTDKVQLTLFQLQEQIRGSIESEMEGKYWVKAEISDIKNHPAGHCYLELIDKPSEEKPVSARAQAIIWSSSYRLIKPYFETSAGSSLSKGMHILVMVQVQYSPLYGLSLIITDIDPSYTVGELEVARQRTINRLREEGMLDLNGSLSLPSLPRRIAVVSSASAAGYADFLKHLHFNEYGFAYKTELFEALMQGENAPLTIVKALERVAERMTEFDVVLIIRGGGSSHDLSCFDDYELSLNIAQFPLPVITGIGHEQDYHVADMVAHTSVKTPTAAADFLIDIFAGEQQQIDYLSRMIRQALSGRISGENNRLSRYESRIRGACKMIISASNHTLDLLEQRITANSSAAIMSRGFAMLFRGGERIKRADEIEPGDKIKIILEGGRLIATVNSKENEKK